MRAGHLLGIALVAALIAPAATSAQPRGGEDVESDQVYVDGLRREDPQMAERFLALRKARVDALSDLRKVEAQYNAAGPQLQAVFLRSLREARKKYAETSLALLDFFEERDRALIVRYQDEIGKIRTGLEERRRTRAELEKLLTR